MRTGRAARVVAALLGVLLMAGCGSSLGPRGESPALSSACASPAAYQSSAVPYPAGPLAPVFYSVRTTRPVVFLTIDDGWTRDPWFASDLKRLHVPTSFFLVANAAAEDYSYFLRLEHLGAVAEDHTVSHPECARLSYSAQVSQICDTATTYERVFGRRPALFRPPYGEFDDATRRAAAACGMAALVNWDVTVNAGRLAFAVGTHLRPGDIILLHFTSNIRQDFAAALTAASQAGFTVARLEDYL